MTLRQPLPLPVLVALTFLTACDSDGSDPAKNRGAGATVAQRTCAAVDDTPVALPGGTFPMGETDVYAEEGPVRDVTVDAFRIDRHEVTNRQFAAFVNATGYITVAEKPVDPKLFGVPVEQIPPEMLKPGSAVFRPPATPSNRYTDWWEYRPGTSWKKPYGPDGADAVPGEPVVHLTYEDMTAYARWAGGRLPSEAEWEYAARAGEPSVNVQPTEANSWQGVFPVKNDNSDGFGLIAPVGCFKPNTFGLYDMVGNVWELTADWYAAGHDPNRPLRNPTGPTPETSFDPANPGLPSRVIKGGSYLCAPNYCQRYRPAARSGRDANLGASNVGFRLVYDPAPNPQNGR